MMKTNKLYAPEMHWENITLFPGTAEAKVLRDDGPGKAKTMLVRFHPGEAVKPHTHVATVQHYVIEGEYESEGSVYGAGTYRRLPEHTDVGCISTQNGVTILMIYDPV